MRVQPRNSRREILEIDGITIEIPQVDEMCDGAAFVKTIASIRVYRLRRLTPVPSRLSITQLYPETDGFAIVLVAG